MIVSFLNQKGGLGKSTLSINVAAFMARKPRKVLLIDADAQGTASGWAAIRSEGSSFQVVSMARDNMAKDALAMAADYQDTIIAGPPGAAKRTSLRRRRSGRAKTPSPRSKRGSNLQVGAGGKEAARDIEKLCLEIERINHEEDDQSIQRNSAATNANA